MLTWLLKSYDSYATHPAFLKVGSRPVVFVYVAEVLTPPEWHDIVQRLHASERDLFLMADSTHAAWLDAFRGQFTYATAGIPRLVLPSFNAQERLRVVMHNLTSATAGERRVYAATVSPGYDDSRLDRRVSSVVDREDGRLYDAQWAAALAAAPDWVLVTSWNEFLENTHIEPSERYGDRYKRLTRVWSMAFRRKLHTRVPAQRH
jgi:hypothetical protein